MSADVVNGPPPAGIARAGAVARIVLGAAGLALVLSLAGAFDTDGIGFAHRFALWAVICVLIVGQTSALHALFSRIAPEGRVGQALAALAAILAVCPLAAAEIFALKATPLAPSWWGDDPFGALLVFTAPPVLTMAALTVALRAPAVQRAAGIEALGARTGAMLRLAAPESFAPAITGLLPPPAPDLSDWPAGAISAVQARDHYLEVETATGRRFVRGRMADVEARLAGADGLRVHRSWWVARGAVVAIRRERRDHVLILAGGREIPVSRARLAALRERGWL